MGLQLKAVFDVVSESEHLAYGRLPSVGPYNEIRMEI